MDKETCISEFLLRCPNKGKLKKCQSGTMERISKTSKVKDDSSNASLPESINHCPIHKSFESTQFLAFGSELTSNFHCRQASLCILSHDPPASTTDFLAVTEWCHFSAKSARSADKRMDGRYKEMY